MRLGRKVETVPYHLENPDNNNYTLLHVTSRVAYLRYHDKYENIYITSDKTKYQRFNHKWLVDELKWTKANGEDN